MAAVEQDISICKLLTARQSHFLSRAVSSSSFEQEVCTRLYRNASWPSTTFLKDRPESIYGSVFNIEFSPVNDIALTVCSNRAIASYDPRLSSSKPLHIVKNAHDDCVNCLTFLDPLSFATCSDDKTIRIWDLRQFKHSVAVMQGHKNWVKNVEYDRKNGLLFSIAFHDGVRVWDVNKMTEYTKEDCSNLVCVMFDPVRMKLSPDGSKMFISERKNRCWVINNFDGKTFQGRDMTTMQKVLSQSENRPSLHVMSGLKREESYRTVMSVSFFPSGDFIALRHMDVKNLRFHAENLTLYDLRQNSEECYHPVYSAIETQEKYLLYADEDSPVEALDYIKELSLSKDGRIIASPYKRGVRLLAVDALATPPEVFFDDRYFSHVKSLCSQDLEVLQTIDGHNRAVVTCKFANNDMVLGTGCLEGHVLFHKPHL